MKNGMCLVGLLTLALCASLPALADSSGIRCGQDNLPTSYARRMACEDSSDRPGSFDSASPVALRGSDLLIRMDIIGNSGETTPEPSSLILLGGGLLGAFATLRRGATR